VNFFKNLLGKIGNLVVRIINAERQIEICRDQSARLESKRKRLHSCEALQNQRRRNQEHESERDLTDDQPVPGAACA